MESRHPDVFIASNSIISSGTIINGSMTVSSGPPRRPSKPHPALRAAAEKPSESKEEEAGEGCAGRKRPAPDGDEDDVRARVLSMTPGSSVTVVGGEKYATVIANGKSVRVGPGERVVFCCTSAGSA